MHTVYCFCLKIRATVIRVRMAELVKREKARRTAHVQDTSVGDIVDQSHVTLIRVRTEPIVALLARLHSSVTVLRVTKDGSVTSEVGQLKQPFHENISLSHIYILQYLF